jgi:hypothetical protein
MFPITAIPQYQTHYRLVGAKPFTPRFGSDAASPAPAKTDKKDATPEGGWLSRKWSGCTGGVGTALSTIWSYVWPLNWSVFKAKPAEAPAPAPDAKPKTATKEDPKAVDPTKAPADAPPEAPADAAKKEKKPTTLMGIVKGSLRVALNTLQIAGAAFVFIGASAFHMPFAVGIAVTIAVLLAQSWIAKKGGEHIDVHDPQKMKKIAEFILEQYRIYGSKFVSGSKKIPLIGRPAGWLAEQAYHGIRTLIRTPMLYMAEKVIPGFVSMSHVSPDFWDKGLFGKLTSVSTMILSSTLGLICKPLGPIGRLIMNFFNIQDAVKIARGMEPPSDGKKPPPSTDPPPTPKPA